MRKLLDEALVQSELSLYRHVEFMPREILSILSDGLLDDASDLLVYGASLDHITYPNLVTNMLDALVFVNDFLSYGKKHNWIASDTLIQDPKVNGELVLCRLKKVIMCNWKKSTMKVLESRSLKSRSPSSFAVKDIEALIRSTDIKYDQHQHLFAEYLESGRSFFAILNINQVEDSLPLMSALRKRFEITSSLMILRFLLLVKSLKLCEDWCRRGFGSMHSPYVRHEKSWGMIDTQVIHGDDDESGQELEIACFPKLLSEINDMNDAFALSMNNDYMTSFCACLANMRCCSSLVKGNPDDVLRRCTSSNEQEEGKTLSQTSVWVTIMYHDLPKEALSALKRIVSIVHQSDGVDEKGAGVSHHEDVNRSDGIGHIERFPILNIDEKKKSFHVCLPIGSVRIWKDVEIDSLMATAANVHIGQIVRIDDYESLLVAHKRFDWWEYAEEGELKMMSSKKAEVINTVEAFTRHRIGVKFEFKGRIVMDAIPIECLIHYLFDPDYFSSSSSSNDSKTDKKSGVRMLTSIEVNVKNQRDQMSLGENTRKYLSSISEFIKMEKKVQKLRDFDKNRGKKKRISMRDRSIDSIDWSTIGSDATMNLSAQLDEDREDYQGDQRGVAFNDKRNLKRKTPLSKPLGIPVPVPPRKSKVNGNRTTQQDQQSRYDTDRYEPVTTRDVLKEMQPHSTLLKDNVALHKIHSEFDWIQPPPAIEAVDEESQSVSSQALEGKCGQDNEPLAVIVTKALICRGQQSSNAFDDRVKQQEDEDKWKPTFGDILAMTANSITNRVVSDVLDIFEPEQHIEIKLARRSKQLLAEYRVESQTRHKDHLHIAPLRLIAVPRESRRTFTTNPTSEALIRQVLQEASESYSVHGGAETISVYSDPQIPINQLVDEWIDGVVTKIDMVVDHPEKILQAGITDIIARLNTIERDMKIEEIKNAQMDLMQCIRGGLQDAPNEKKIIQAFTNSKKRKLLNYANASYNWNIGEGNAMHEYDDTDDLLVTGRSVSFHFEGNEDNPAMKIAESAFSAPRAIIKPKKSSNIKLVRDASKGGLSTVSVGSQRPVISLEIRAKKKRSDDSKSSMDSSTDQYKTSKRRVPISTTAAAAKSAAGASPEKAVVFESEQNLAAKSPGPRVFSLLDELRNRRSDLEKIIREKNKRRVLDQTMKAASLEDSRVSDYNYIGDDSNDHDGGVLENMPKKAPTVEVADLVTDMVNQAVDQMTDHMQPALARVRRMSLEDSINLTDVGSMSQTSQEQLPTFFQYIPKDEPYLHAVQNKKKIKFTSSTKMHPNSPRVEDNVLILTPRSNVATKHDENMKISVKMITNYSDHATADLAEHSVDLNPSTLYSWLKPVHRQDLTQILNKFDQSLQKQKQMEVADNSLTLGLSVDGEKFESFAIYRLLGQSINPSIDIRKSVDRPMYTAATRRQIELAAKEEAIREAQEAMRKAVEGVENMDMGEKEMTLSATDLHKTIGLDTDSVPGGGEAGGVEAIDGVDTVQEGDYLANEIMTNLGEEMDVHTNVSVENFIGDVKPLLNVKPASYWTRRAIENALTENGPIKVTKEISEKLQPSSKLSGEVKSRPQTASVRRPQGISSAKVGRPTSAMHVSLEGDYMTSERDGDETDSGNKFGDIVTGSRIKEMKDLNKDKFFQQEKQQRHYLKNRVETALVLTQMKENVDNTTSFVHPPPDMQSNKANILMSDQDAAADLDMSQMMRSPSDMIYTQSMKDLLKSNYGKPGNLQDFKTSNIAMNEELPDTLAATPVDITFPVLNYNMRVSNKFGLDVPVPTQAEVEAGVIVDTEAVRARAKMKAQWTQNSPAKSPYKKNKMPLDWDRVMEMKEEVEEIERTGTVASPSRTSKAKSPRETGAQDEANAVTDNSNTSPVVVRPRTGLPSSARNKSPFKRQKKVVEPSSKKQGEQFLFEQALRNMEDDSSITTGLNRAVSQRSLTPLLRPRTASRSRGSAPKPAKDPLSIVLPNITTKDINPARQEEIVGTGLLDIATAEDQSPFAEFNNNSLYSDSANSILHKNPNLKLEKKGNKIAATVSPAMVDDEDVRKTESKAKSEVPVSIASAPPLYIQRAADELKAERENYQNTGFNLGEVIDNLMKKRDERLLKQQQAALKELEKFNH